MFWKKRKAPTDQVMDDAAKIIEALKPKWEMFCQTIPFRADVPLANRIEAFASPAMAGMMQQYPSTKSAPPSVLWLMVFTAVLESKTHPTADVNAAIAQLEMKYAGT